MIVFSDLIQNQLFGFVKKTKNPVYTKKTKITYSFFKLRPDLLVIFEICLLISVQI